MKFKVERARDAMDSWRTGVIFVVLGLALISSSGACSAKAQNKKNDCGHQPKILSQARFSDEDRAKWKGKSVTGKVAIVVSEEGDVTQARVLAASPKEATEALLNAAKQMKFEPRRGCGKLKTEIHFSLGEK
ncbi:MAG: TonB family protein [Candidatus Acidiferrum sp.]